MMCVLHLLAKCCKFINEPQRNEDIDIKNNGSKFVKFNLEIAFGFDFADIFEVESQQCVRWGDIETRYVICEYLKEP
ncbi:glycogen debranching N-terminal domain-containing protein [Nodularia sp. UHCC 0506]|uniref:glycogen debranching N-terminal domain-containing protein n=1 Tax=Nodularia sp. UHCC 0506 TaxID=3110243 RepID=UPI003A4C61F8